MRLFIFGMASLLAGTQAAAEAAGETVSGAADRESTAITVYNDDLALVRERRKLQLPAGLVRLSLREVSARMRPETALLRAVGGSPLDVLEQNFDFDLLTPAKLLEKYVGHEVTVIRQNPASGEEKREQATVLAASDGVVLRFADRIETGVPGRIAYPDVPADLRDRPTLSMLIAGSGGKQSLELSYLTGGLSWKADYVANLTADNRQMDLSGWVTLTNSSGIAYRDAHLQLVAGSVNRVRDAVPPVAYAPSPLVMARKAEVTQEALMDFHLYTFDRPTSIADNQTKQLALLSASAIPVQREYLLSGSEWTYRERMGQPQKLKPAVYVEFENKGGQLGKPLPAGVVRVYARDGKGAAQFVGEDRVQHTARNEKLRLKLGEAFDLNATRTQTAWRKLGENAAEVAYRIEIRNAKEEAATVRVREALPGDWEITQENLRHEKESSRLASWQVKVPAGGAATLEYTARMRW